MNHQNSYIPIAINLDKKRILVIGAGHVAHRKVKTLMGRGASLKVVAPKIDSNLLKLLIKNKIPFLKRPFQNRDLQCQEIVIIATNDPGLNQKIASACVRKGMLYNSVTSKTPGFMFTSFLEREDLMLAVSTKGQNPKMARAIREALEQLILDSDLKGIAKKRLARTYRD